MTATPQSPRDAVYLSPAFSPRSPEELEVLRGLNGDTAFGLFWLDVVRPVLEARQARRILEIGAAEGEHTRLLLRYCDQRDAQLIVIEPFVTAELRAALGSTDRARLHEGKSREMLPRIDVPIDAVMLEGDLNYYAACHDLLDIQQMSVRNKTQFPLVFFTATTWPYARRDMYYDPETLAPDQRHEYARSGLTPWSPGLHEGLINFPFANALTEGGPGNGVLTGVEDFLRDSGLPLRLFSLPANHGLGILYFGDSPEGRYIADNLQAPPGLRRFIETWEIARQNHRVLGLHPVSAANGTVGASRAFGRALRRLRRAVIGRIER